jgi:SWI/SNF-related matrix-associated actin-dependent regulator 1 of chromatin subfamily A
MAKQQGYENVVMTWDTEQEFPKYYKATENVTGWFIVETNFEQSALVSKKKGGAGFWWTPEIKAWRTNKLEIASKLIDYADDAAAAQLTDYISALEDSRATDADIEIPCPEGLAYLPYQRGGIAYAMSRESTLFGDEMGLGKTIQAIGTINATPEAKRVLIICLASIKLNWAKELGKWLVNDSLSIGVAMGKDFPDTDIVIMNYDILKNHKETIQGIDWDILIADEVHYLKNPKAQRTQYVVGNYGPKKVDGKWQQVGTIEPIEAKRKLFLTGTPLVNRPVELWTLINYLDASNVRSNPAFVEGTDPTWWGKSAYQKRYCAATHNGWGYDTSGASNLAELQEKLRSSFMIRRLKKDVLTELPAKRRQVVPVEDAQIVAKETAALSKVSGMVDIKKALEAASDDPKAYEAAVRSLESSFAASFEEISRIRHETALDKIPHILAHINECFESNEEGYKLVVFAHHRDVVKAIEAEYGSRCVSIVGGDSIESRQEATDRFQNDSSVDLFVGSIGATGTGVDGLQNASQHALFVEFPWTPGALTQAEDRLHRMGQLGSVLIQHLVLEDSIDAYMIEMIVEKQNVSDRTLDTGVKTKVVPEAIEKVVPAPITTPKPGEEITKDNAVFSDGQKEAILSCLKSLSAVCDGANEEDKMGFNGTDSRFGKDLARNESLSNKQAWFGRKIIKKYHRQLDTATYEKAIAPLEGE